MTKFIVNTRNWRDKVNGNSYTSIEVLRADNQKVLFSRPMEYGYGGMNEQIAKQELIKRGLIKHEVTPNKERKFVPHEVVRSDIYFSPPQETKQRDMYGREENEENYKDLILKNPVINTTKPVIKHNLKPQSVVREHKRTGTRGVRRHVRRNKR